MREAIQLNHGYIGTEHILLGMVRANEGVANQVLVKLGAEPAAVRQAVMDLISGYPGNNSGEKETAGVGAGNSREGTPAGSTILDQFQRVRASWTRSSAATRRWNASCRSSPAAPRTTPC